MGGLSPQQAGGASSAIANVGNTLVQINANKAQSAFLDSQADINSMFAELQAKDALRRGDELATEYAKRVRQVKGSQRASLAASGVEVGSGTALDLQAETAEIGALDIINIKNNAYRQAFGFEQESLGIQAQNDFNQIRLKGQRKQTLITGGLRAVNSGSKFF